MKKIVCYLLFTVYCITGYAMAPDSLTNAAIIGQPFKNQKAGKGLQVGMVGSTDTLQANGYVLIDKSTAIGGGIAASALLNITSTTKGILLPRMSTAQMLAISSPATGLTVFNTDSNKFYYYASSTWIQLGTTSGWSLTGNSGINPATNYIGTTDDSSLIFKVGGVKSGEIASTNTTINTGFGYGALAANPSGNANSAFGGAALTAVTSGENNTAVGVGALQKDTTGSENTAIGISTLAKNLTGDENTAIGESALNKNTTGDHNVALGAHSMRNNTTGSNNVAVGYEAGVYGTYSNRLFIDNQDRLDATQQERKSLITGTFGNDSSDQSIRINGKLLISDGTQANGKMLACDATGTGTWTATSTTEADSATIYALTPSTGTQYYCTDCTGNGITGRIVAFIGAAWRRLKFDE